MKKIICFVLVLTVLLTACAAPASPPDSSSATDTPASTTPTATTTTTPPPQTTTTPVTTTAPPEPITFDQTGSGDSVIRDVFIDSYYNVITLSHDGDSNFIVRGHCDDGSSELLVNEIGPYNGTVLLGTVSPYMLEIKADGNWSVHVETIVGDHTSTSFSGTGDFVTTVIMPKTKIFKITHDGESNIIVRQHSDEGTELLVNEIGPYSGEVVSRISVDQASLFEVIADGNWTITPIY